MNSIFILSICFVFGILIMSFTSYYYKHYYKDEDVRKNIIYKIGSYIVVGSWLMASFLFIKKYL